MYVAVTVRACDIVSEHGPLELVHAPDHPPNRHPEAALLGAVHEEQPSEAPPGLRAEVLSGLEVSG